MLNRVMMPGLIDVRAWEKQCICRTWSSLCGGSTAGDSGVAGRHLRSIEGWNRSPIQNHQKPRTIVDNYWLRAGRTRSMPYRWNCSRRHSSIWGSHNIRHSRPSELAPDNPSWTSIRALSAAERPLSEVVCPAW